MLSCVLSVIQKLNTMSEKPYAESCERNSPPIFEIISPLLVNTKAVLEIGSGTGQHAVYFAERMPHLLWHTSDKIEYHMGIQLWVTASKLSNVTPPIIFDVSNNQSPEVKIDAVFSANTTHIMNSADVENMIKKVGKLLPKQGLFLLYGPFKIDGHFSSDNDALFDQHLRLRNVGSCIRNIEDLDRLAEQAGLLPLHRYTMPRNNHLICWKRQ